MNKPITWRWWTSDAWSSLAIITRNIGVYLIKQTRGPRLFLIYRIIRCNNLSFFDPTFHCLTKPVPPMRETRSPERRATPFPTVAHPGKKGRNSELCRAFRWRLQVTNETHISRDYIPLNTVLKEDRAGLSKQNLRRSSQVAQFVREIRV